MAKKPRVPSLQHLARNWFDDPRQIARTYVNLVENPPFFNYNALFSAVIDLLLFRQPYDQVEEGIRRGVKRSAVQKNLLETLPLIDSHFSDIDPDYIQAVGTRYYPAGRDLLVPFKPPIFYGVDGTTHFPWFSFWRNNPLQDRRLSLFVTLVKEMLSEDPDLEDARFEILDFSAPKGSKSRELVVIDAMDIPLVTEAEKKEMLRLFADGFLLASEILEKRPSREKGDRESQHDDNHPDLFGDT